MPGLMARILSRRADDARPQPDQPTIVAPALGDGQIAPVPVVVEEPAPPPAPADAVPAAGTDTAPPTGTSPAGDATPGQVEAGGPAAEPEPAPEQVAAQRRAALAARSRMRRRLRYLRRVRELAFRDLGGLVFDLHRFGRERPDLVELKLAGLASIDAELRALEAALADERDVEELAEPGISACAHCGALHGSDARFCPACGAAAGTLPPAPVEAAAGDAAPDGPADPAAASPPAAEPASPPAA